MVKLFLNNRRYTTLPVIENIVTKRSLQTVVISMLFAQLEETLFGMICEGWSLLVPCETKGKLSHFQQQTVKWPKPRYLPLQPLFTRVS